MARPENDKSHHSEAKNDEHGSGELGTGLVPASSEQTARRIAGSQAAAKATPGQTTSGNPANRSDNIPGPRSFTGGMTSAASSQRATEGTKRGSPSGSQGADSTAKMSPAREEPWMARLPPEIRQPIGANTRQAPPRGYEELLRRYFQREE